MIMKKGLKILSMGLMMMMLSSCTTLNFNALSNLLPFGNSSSDESSVTSESHGSSGSSGSTSSSQSGSTTSSSGNSSSGSSSSGSTTSSGSTSSGNSSSSGSTSSGSSSSSEEQEDLDKYTIMIYMCGSDLESDNGLGTMDIQEILSVNNQPDNVNIIIETGGASSWNSTYGISSSKLGRYHVENKKLVKETELTYASMGLSSTFQSFLEWGLTKYPAEKTGVILWNHGGAMRGVCYDEKKSDDALLNSEVNSALKNAFSKTGRTEKLEWIGYDACLMQVQDIAEFNSQYFNYMIGAEESEAGEGWDYDTWVDDLYAGKSTPTILKAICDGFIQSYQDTYGAYYGNDQTLSYLNLSYMTEYKTAFEALASQLKSKVSSNTSSFKNMLKNNVQCYGTSYYTKEDLSEMGISTSQAVNNYGMVYQDGYYIDYGYNYFGTFDVKDFLDNLKSNSTYSSLSSYISNVETAFNKLVEYNKTGADAGDSNGLVMFFPMDEYCEKSTYYASSQTNFTNWRSLVSSYGA